MFKKTLKCLIILTIGFLIAFFSIRYYVKNGGRRIIANETPEYQISAKKIASEFASNTSVSNKKYLEKSILITGEVTSINENEVIVDYSVNCSFLTISDNIKKDQKVVVKGRVVGYDDLMGEVKIDQCSLSK